MLLLLAFFSITGSKAATTVTLSTPASTGPLSMCPGSTKVVIYEFTLTATGLLPGTILTGVSFTQSGTATNADIARYQLWSGPGGSTLVATSSVPSFSGLSTGYNGLFATTINYRITADLSTNAIAGRTIIVAPMTTANFMTSTGFRATFGTIATGGTQTVLLAPSAIYGIPRACAGATTSLGNGVSGGTWSSSDLLFATVDPGSGVVTGVAAGTPVITYQLSTGCYQTIPVNINPLPEMYNVTGGGNYCAGGAGVHVGLSGSDAGIYYQLYTGIMPTGDPEGIGGPLDFGLQTAAGTYTAIATNMSTLCSRNMAGSADVHINPLPTVYTVTGGGTYCAGGSGYAVGLSGSDEGINYQLYKGEAAIGEPYAGTGSAVDFGIFTAPGNYSVTATNAHTGCNKDMAGSAEIIVNPLPDVYRVLGGGDYCAGGEGVHVLLSWSQAGIVYVLYNDGATVGIPTAGSGLPIDLGLQTVAGHYTVVAINATTTCSSGMTGSAIVVVDPLPNPYTITGGGSYCADGAGLPVGLSSSDEDAMYLLYRGTSIAGTPTSGSGGALDFGLQTDAGVYTVVAVNSRTTCINTMPGSASITINPLPAIYPVTGGGSYCADGAGLHVGMDGSEAGIFYQLYNGTNPVGMPAGGTSYSIDFGLQTLPGIYTVVATNHATLCTTHMDNSVSIIINDLPPVHNVTGGGYYCKSGRDTAFRLSAGGAAVHVGLDGSDAGMIYQLYNGATLTGDPVAGTGEAIDFGAQYAAGYYTVLAIDATTLCTNNMAGGASVNYYPVVIPDVNIFAPTGVIGCEGSPETFTALPVNGGTAPSYSWKVNGATAGFGTSFTYFPVDGDDVSVTMLSDAFCAEPLTAVRSFIMLVIPPVVPSVTISASSGTNIMPGEPVIFTVNIIDGDLDPICQWYVNGYPAIVSLIFTTNTLANNDVVKCRVTRNDACQLYAEHSLVMTVADVGVPQVSSDAIDFKVIPNPSNGTFTISGILSNNADIDASVDITNILGQVIYKNKLTAFKGKINEQVNLGNIVSGMYILNIRAGNEHRAMHIEVQ